MMKHQQTPLFPFQVCNVHSLKQMESLCLWSAQKWLLKITYNEQSLLRFGMFCCQCCLKLTDDIDFSLLWTRKLLVRLQDEW